MRGEIDQQVETFGLAVERRGIRARRHEPVVQPNIGRGEMHDEFAIELDQPVAVVELGEGEPVSSEFGHHN